MGQGVYAGLSGMGMLQLKSVTLVEGRHPMNY